MINEMGNTTFDLYNSPKMNATQLLERWSEKHIESERETQVLTTYDHASIKVIRHFMIITQ